MWTNENRARYDRRGLRYPSDLTDDEWALIGPLIPPAKRGGNKRTVDVRAVVNGVMYVLRSRATFPRPWRRPAAAPGSRGVPGHTPSSCSARKGDAAI